MFVIAGKPEEELIEEKQAVGKMSVQEHVEYYANQGSTKEAMKLAAKDRGVSMRDIYNECK